MKDIAALFSRQSTPDDVEGFGFIVNRLSIVEVDSPYENESISTLSL